MALYIVLFFEVGFKRRNVIEQLATLGATVVKEPLWLNLDASDGLITCLLRMCSREMFNERRKIREHLIAFVAFMYLSRRNSKWRRWITSVMTYSCSWAWRRSSVRKSSPHDTQGNWCTSLSWASRADAVLKCLEHWRQPCLWAEFLWEHNELWVPKDLAQREQGKGFGCLRVSWLRRPLSVSNILLHCRHSNASWWPVSRQCWYSANLLQNFLKHSKHQRDMVVTSKCWICACIYRTPYALHLS